jgi:hypothetical protein
MYKVNCKSMDLFPFYGNGKKNKFEQYILAKQIEI